MGQEAADGVIKLEGDDVHAVRAMLRFMYASDYDSSSDEGQISTILLHVKIYGAAEKYGVSALKRRAQEKFEASLKTNWDLDDLPRIVSEIYGSTPPNDRGLRDAIVKSTYKHVRKLLKKTNFLTVLEEKVGFAAMMTQLLAQQPIFDSKLVNCQQCNRVCLIPLKDGQTCYCVHCGIRHSNWKCYYKLSDLKEYECPKCGSHWLAYIGSEAFYSCFQCGFGGRGWENHVRE